MELKNERDARFLVHHQVTEEKLLHLEKGVRKLGFRSGGNKILGGLLLLAVLALLGGTLFQGIIGFTLTAAGCLAGLLFLGGVYSIFRAWADAKREIHINYEAVKKSMNHVWEYRFYEDCYEVLGKNETARVQYSNLGRLIEFSGMFVLIERGNVVRYFMKQDITKGTADEMAGFLERKSGAKFEFVSVR